MQVLHPDMPIQLTLEKLIPLHTALSLRSSDQHTVEDAISTLVQGIGIEAFWKLVCFDPDNSGDGT